MWRRVELFALLATIPAFYLAMLSAHRAVGVALYLMGFAATAAVAWTETFGAQRAVPARNGLARNPLSLLLAISLLLSAVLPQGEQADLLAVRLGAAALIILRLGESTLPSSWRGGLPQLLGLGIGVLGLCGLGFWWLEPRAHSFGDGLWLAFTTAATVGYGDIVPSTPPSKIFAVFVVLMGFAVLSLVTASIAALWVQTEERKIEREVLRDLHHELRAIRDELTALRRAQAPYSES
jgi:voltage-gated potassium channel